MKNEKIRISAGQSVCGGSIDWHQTGDSFRAHWCVQGAIEFPDTEDGVLEAQAMTARILQEKPDRLAYPYGGRLGQWAPPDGSERFSTYSPR